MKLYSVKVHDFRLSSVKKLRTVLFWVITQCVVVILLKKLPLLAA